MVVDDIQTLDFLYLLSNKAKAAMIMAVKIKKLMSTVVVVVVVVALICDLFNKINERSTY